MMDSVLPRTRKSTQLDAQPSVLLLKENSGQMGWLADRNGGERVVRSSITKASLPTRAWSWNSP